VLRHQVPVPENYTPKSTTSRQKPNHSEQKWRSSHQNMTILKSQLKQAQDQIDKATTDNSHMRREILRLSSLLQDARDEEDRLGAEIDWKI